MTSLTTTALFSSSNFTSWSSSEIDAFGRNEHLRKVFWALFLALAGLVLARIVDPATAQNILGILAGTG